MTSTRRSRVRRIAHGVKSAWADMDYAQRRLLEVQSGVSGLTPRKGGVARGYGLKRAPRQYA